MVLAKSALPAHLIREVAVSAESDPRTVAKLVSGERVRPMTARRIERALRKRGLRDLLPQHTQENDGDGAS